MTGRRRGHPLFIERVLSVLPVSEEEKTQLIETSWGLESHLYGRSASLDLLPILPVAVPPEATDPALRMVCEEYKRTLVVYSQYELAHLKLRVQLGQLNQALARLVGLKDSKPASFIDVAENLDTQHQP